MEEKGSPFLQNLSLLVRALFCEVDPKDILNGTLFFDDVAFQTAADYMMLDPDTSSRYSRMECRKIAEVSGEFVYAQRMRRFSGRGEPIGRLSVFSALMVLAELLLRPEEPVVCRYEQLIPWRQIAKDICEDFPVAAMYAQKDLERGHEMRRVFDWNTVIGHDNQQLNTLMRRGISEHHFHLFSSLPYFQISWVNLMNAVNQNYYLDHLRQIEQQSKVLQKNDYITHLLNHQYESSGTSVLVLHHLQAALIRAYLFQRLTNGSDSFGGLMRVYTLLRTPEALQLEAAALQNTIVFLQTVPGEDYALSQVHGWSKNESGRFWGERWFLYAMLRDIGSELHSRRLNRDEHNLFYAYLCLQNELRAQMVQINGHVGFDNFQRYEHRRGFFVPANADSLRMSARMAVRDPLLNAPHLQEVEIRISPLNSSYENYQFISLLDHAICGTQGLPNVSDEPPVSRSRFYYVYHFIKRPDRNTDSLPPFWKESELLLKPWQYRHDLLRSKLEQQAMALIAFREKYPKAASRVHGIDAASQEIGCRPEVFAPVFRLLSAHQPVQDDAAPALPHLKKTYHAGEDFLDVVDGLRAIDEAIHFLDLRHGDRIGHAIALGIDVKEWYHGKKDQIVLSKHDYIDNLAWLYHALTYYEIEVCSSLREFLRTEFDHYFREVYLVHLNESDLETIMQQGAAYNQAAGNHFAVNRHRSLFDIEIYYKAWCLRGDHPSLYRDGYYKAPVIPVDDLDLHRTNFAFPEPFSYRFIPECSALCYHYHYNPLVKSAGKSQIILAVPRMYVDACAAVQKCMQRDIAQRGISIETNPSSNVLISTFREYQKHPIYRFYSKHLSSTSPDDCAQLHISINTDDNGVFFTSLENEYALIARSTELLKDEQTNAPLYKKADIYEWLDDIRKMSNEQGFSNEPAGRDQYGTADTLESPR